LREVAFHETGSSEFYLALSQNGPGPRMSRDDLIGLAALEVQGREEIVFDEVPVTRG
jgi:hypothetical protein